MEKPEVTTRQAQHAISQMRSRTSPGPDGLKNKLNKALAKTAIGIKVITKYMNNEINTSRKPATWKISNTRMIAKESKPTAKQLRPIALPDAPYKMFMSMIREKKNTLT